MSKYVTYDVLTIKSLEILLAALAELGWHSGRVEVHEQPQTLYGYHGDARTENAHVVIRRHNTGIGSSNDIGFLKTKEGNYKPIVSEYDSTLTNYGQRAGGKFVDSVGKAYGKVCGTKALDTVLTKTIPDMKRRGVIPRNATARTVLSGKTTKIVVTY
jgi:hypothetical protein